MQGGFPCDRASARVEGFAIIAGQNFSSGGRPARSRPRAHAVYEKNTKPLTDFYRQRGLLVTIEAEGTPEEIYQRTSPR